MTGAPQPGPHAARDAVALGARLWHTITLTGELVRWKHTVFALPFIYATAFLAYGGVPPAATLGWITLAAAGARTAAMAINRIVDADIDRLNPRTAGRPIPSGRMSAGQAFVVALMGALALIVAAGQLNPLALWLSPLPVLAFVIYPYTKRWTWACHGFLALAQAMGPGGAWVAVRAAVEGPAWLLGGAVGLWIGGFDVIYALLDLDFDRRYGIQSLPQRYGVPAALACARWAHAAAMALWVMAGWATGRAWWYFGGLALTGALLVWQHAYVARDPSDPRRVQRAFDSNGYISLVMLAASLLDVLRYP